MDKRRNRYKLAVYLFLGSVAIILALMGLGFSEENSASQNIYLNLATEIMGFVILFFIIERLFLLDESRNYSEQIHLLRQEIKAKFNPLYWEDPHNYRFKLFDQLEDAKELYLLGYTLNVLEKLRGVLPDAINEGLKVKILILDPESDAFKTMLGATKSPQKVQNTMDRSLDYLEQIAKQINENHNRKKGSFEARLVSWLPSCTMIIIRKDKNRGLANVAVNSIHFDLPPGKIRNRLSMILYESGDEQEFEYFLNQYLLLWNSDLARNFNAVQ